MAKKYFSYYSKFICILLLVLFLNSCASTPPAPPPQIPQNYVSPPTPAYIIRSNVVHIVAPGETFWRLSKMYDVSIDDIAKTNNLDTSSAIEIGQKLIIPNAAPIKPVIPLYPSTKWRYIIIHHSATDEGSSLYFNIAHKKRGFDNGVGYHFVIDNGTREKIDGQIEATPRWIKQMNGAHCKASEMNYKAIGICLVGNFNIEEVNKEQMDSLVYLVRVLKDYYKIPSRNILGHGQVRAARTDCPGKLFPWTEFKSRIK
ncbi:MAG: N-acetylmuramoyl-L-alanine amidase [Candidatus Omnitrophota bacterium]